MANRLTLSEVKTLFRNVWDDIILDASQGDAISWDQMRLLREDIIDLVAPRFYYGSVGRRDILADIRLALVEVRLQQAREHQQECRLM